MITELEFIVLYLPNLTCQNFSYHVKPMFWIMSLKMSFKFTSFRNDYSNNMLEMNQIYIEGILLTIPDIDYKNGDHRNDGKRWHLWVSLTTITIFMKMIMIIIFVFIIEQYWFNCSNEYKNLTDIVHYFNENNDKFIIDSKYILS